MEFKRVKIDPSIETKVAETFDQLQDSIKDLANNLPDASGISIEYVSGGQKLLDNTNRYLFANSDGGPITFVLPLPLVAQELTFIKENANGGEVKIVTKDGKKIGTGETSLTLSWNVPISMVCSKKQWWVSK